MLLRAGVDLTACWRARVGMVTASLELTAALLRQGRAELTLFCSGRRPAGLESAGRALLSPHRHELANKLLWLPAIEADAHLDVVFYPYWPCPPRRRTQAPPAVVFVHDLAFRLRPAEVPWEQRAYLGMLLPRAVEQAAALVVPSQVTRSDLLECYPRPGLDERVHVIPEAPAGLGPDAGPLPSGLKPGYLLAVGTVESRKNYVRLLQAYDRLRRTRPVPPLVVAGRPGWRCRRELAALHTTPGVRYLGHVSDSGLAALYRGALVFAFPSLYEGFGLPLLEAMGRGVPAMIGDRGAGPELAGGAALEVEVEDPEAMASALTRLLDDAQLRGELAERGQRRAAEFSWDSSANRLLKILEEVA